MTVTHWQAQASMWIGGRGTYEAGPARPGPGGPRRARVRFPALARGFKFKFNLKLLAIIMMGKNLN